MESLLNDFLPYMAAGAAAPPAEMVEALWRDCPAFTLPAVLRLRNGEADADERAELSARAALNVADPAALYSLIGPDATDEPFYPPESEAATPSTSSAIDTFLETYGHAPTAREDALLEELILNPRPDYVSMLEAEYEEEAEPAAAADDNMALIDAFLNKPLSEQFPELTESEAADGEDAVAPAAEATGAAQPPAPERRQTSSQSAPTKPDPESSLSESLAKIYIRQGKYDKAYEIISGLNLNFPEKSIYFADQLRFLQKLMLNRKYK